MKPVAIVEQHHHVIEYWCALRKKYPAPLPVWTLDYHTDTMPCFRGKLPAPAPDIWKDPLGATEAVKLLRHDEHFDWALRAGIISKAYIGICGDNTDIIAHPDISVYRPKDFPSSEVILNQPELFRPQAESVLESHFLSALFPRLPAPGETYILDIDCDYILCRQALFPKDNSVITQLIKNAALLTLSTENDWVKILKLPAETITGTEIAQIIAAWR